ncbi:MAG: DUF3090 family protein [Actinomycetota bacterium]|nr:DUF3090 family protein [Actinomycetota bacterium]
MSFNLEFDPADRVTAGAVGQPGQRVFLLQASKGRTLQTWILEKEQVIALGRGSYELLGQIGQHEMTKELLGKGTLGSSSPEFGEAMALQADEPAFRIDPESMTIRYDDMREMIEISFAELVPDASTEPSTVQLWVTPRQLAALAVQGMKVVAQGRPTCPLCGYPINPEGHICPSSNGQNPRVR